MTIVSLFISLCALLIAIWQWRYGMNQFLFDRRLRVYEITTEFLKTFNAGKDSLQKWRDNPDKVIAYHFLFNMLCNNVVLECGQGSINPDSDHKDEAHVRYMLVRHDVEFLFKGANRLFNRKIGSCFHDFGLAYMKVVNDVWICGIAFNAYVDTNKECSDSCKTDVADTIFRIFSNENIATDIDNLFSARLRINDKLLGRAYSRMYRLWF